MVVSSYLKEENSFLPLKEKNSLEELEAPAH